ncbi:FMN-binding protein [uncultured Sphaerochaeta sp.]|uniref:FMN-binding protein n=1 Tax=uncultured Sphaerochaeta sp. TaxID=886478 RepID=UPI002A0A32B9|nr:FMN-binding protein [uncultured Sphaerochaeta sp.]
MKLLWVLLVVALIIVVVFLLYRRIENKLNALPGLPIADVDFRQVPDGIYSGSYATFPVRVKIEAKMDSGKLTDLSLLEHRNGQGQKAEKILQDVLSSQHLQVDTISGATYSSVVMLKAIESALTEQKSL